MVSKSKMQQTEIGNTVLNLQSENISKESLMHRNLIFNLNGDREASKRKIIKGNTTYINELNEIKYPWAYELYRTMAFANFWTPEEIGMIDDKRLYTILTPYEKRAYKYVLAFLIVLDSYQTNMLKEFARYITAPELVMALTAQEYQEALHSYSYQYILESVVESNDIDEIYNFWRVDNTLKERNQVIAELYNNFIEKPTEENFIKAVIGNYLLESLYFYSGFAFFYTLGAQNKMLNTVQQIRYINRDELTHVTLFKNIFNTIKTEYPDLITPEIKKWIVEYTKFAVDKEINWGIYITNDQIPGLSKQAIKKYIQYLANQRLMQLDFPVLYPDSTENPLKFIDQIAKLSTAKTDFFSSKVQTYQARSELKWD